jgi:hypothetical protein
MRANRAKPTLLTTASIGPLATIVSNTWAVAVRSARSTS